MIRRGFPDSESRRDLIELARDGAAAHRLARRANALVLLDKGMSCQSVAEVLLLDNDTIRTWYQLYQEDASVRTSACSSARASSKLKPAMSTGIFLSAMPAPLTKGRGV